MKILLIVDPTRPDWCDYLWKGTSLHYSLLWFESSLTQGRLCSPTQLNAENEYFWRDYATPKILIDCIRPDKIIFFEIIDLRQIALIVTCKQLGIPTFYLEHGAAGSPSDAVSRWQDFDNQINKMSRIWHRLSSGLPGIISSKLFYFSVFKGFSSSGSYRKFISLPFKFLRHAPNKVLVETIFPERIPDTLITFSRLNYELIEKYTGASIEKAKFTGVPFFDKYFLAKSIQRDYIVFIDHPNLEDKLYNWTAEFHHSIAKKLYDFAKTYKQKVYVKLHPKSDKSRWLSYAFNSCFVEILQTEDCTQCYMDSKLILGYSSSLLTAFLCARKNVVLLGWNPEPKIFGFNFAATGLCHLSLNPDDLNNQFEFWCTNNLSLDEEKYKIFVEYTNPEFDGKAISRVLSIITEELS